MERGRNRIPIRFSTWFVDTGRGHGVKTRLKQDFRMIHGFSYACLAGTLILFEGTLTGLMFLLAGVLFERVVSLSNRLLHPLTTLCGLGNSSRVARRSFRNDRNDMIQVHQIQKRYSSTSGLHATSFQAGAVNASL